MKLTSLALLAVFLWATPQSAEACSCMTVDQPTGFEQAVSVFEGRVSAIVADEEGVVQVAMRIVRTWKGANAEELEVSTRAHGAACGYAFEQDRSYLVYTYRPDDSDTQWVSLCSRTTPIDSEEAAADIAAMGEGITPASPESPEEEILPGEEEYEEDDEDDGNAAGQRPARGGCASCSVGSPADRRMPGVLALSLFALAVVRRGRR